MQSVVGIKRSSPWEHHGKTYSPNKYQCVESSSPNTTDSSENPKPAVKKVGVSASKTPGGKPEGRSWEEKYKPQSTREIVGNKASISAFRNWLQDWHKVVIEGKKKETIKRKGGWQWNCTYNINANSCLIAGSPGIGKTIMAKQIAKDLGFTVKEMTAMDNRSKQAIENMIDYLSKATSIRLHCESEKTKEKAGSNSQAGEKVGKTLILVDELDCVVQCDRGTIYALVNVIKATKNPIVCISNQWASPRLKPLLAHCLLLKMERPELGEIVPRIDFIAKQEQLRIEGPALKQLYELNGRDLRQTITTLQLWKDMDALRAPTTKSIRKELIRKDQKCMLNPFQAMGVFLDHEASSCMTFLDKLNLYYIDFYFLPLMMQENYLSAFPIRVGAPTMHSIAEAADMMSVGSMISGCIFEDGHWSLLDDLGRMGVVGPSILCSSSIQFPKFPEVMGRCSTYKKNARLIKELRQMSRYQFYSGKNTIHTEVAPLIFEMVVSFLQRAKNATSKKGAKANLYMEAAKTIFEFGIPQEAFKDKLVSLLGEARQMLYSREISTTQKMHFTRAYNKLNHQLKTEKTLWQMARDAKEITPSFDLNFEGEFEEQPAELGNNECI